MDASTSSATQVTTQARLRLRRRGLLSLAGVVIVGGAIWFALWFLGARNFESTDDAYVSGDLVQITSEVPGTITAVHVDDTQSVERGQLLAELDPADANVALAAADADLARVVRQVRGLFSQVEQLRAQIVERESILKRAEQDLQRRQRLLADAAVSGEELSHARDAVDQTRAALAAAREQLNTTLAQIQGTTIATHPEVLRAEAAVRNAALALHRTRLVAPVAGVVAKRTVQLGQHIAAGAPLMAVVPLGDVWVDANFKEVQLGRMRIGQPVTLRADLYGKHAEFRGKLVGLSAGSGSAFALLPAQNASGNWIKVVQRVPVRIALDPDQLRNYPLRLGLSMAVDIDVRDASGPMVASRVRTGEHVVQASDGDDPQVESRIAQIVAANSGQPALVGQVGAQKHPHSNPGLPAPAPAVASTAKVNDQPGRADASRTDIVMRPVAGTAL